MQKSLRALLFGLIDYAGLFPPAALSLEAAVARYLADRECADAWMLARFICPAKSLASLPELIPDGVAPLRLSVLAGGGESVSAFDKAAEADCAAIDAFVQTGRGRIESIELKLPPPLVDAERVPELHASIGRTRDLFRSLESAPELYFEGAPSSASHACLIGLLRDHPGCAFKLRTGGVTAEAFPSAAEVAGAISEATSAHIPWKATAGLHHPIRRFDPSIGVTMHGFLNLFLAAALLGAERIDRPTALRLLEDADPSVFHITENGAGWREYEVSASEIERQRAFARSFGSCSFDEPRDDLRALGLLANDEERGHA